METTYLLFAAYSPDKLWMIILLSIVMIACAWVDFRELRVPNAFTFPLILSGWIIALIEGWNTAPGEWVTYQIDFFGLLGPTFQMFGPLGGALDYFRWSVGLTFFGFILLFPLLAIKGVGEGDVKMQMGFGSWAAVIYGWELGWAVVLWGWIFGVLVGGVISAIMIAISGTWAQSRTNMASILGDLFTAGSIKEVGSRAATRKPQLQLLPYGVALCIGYLMFVIYLHFYT